jgi:large subunit ribosomal protein L18
MSVDKKTVRHRRSMRQRIKIRQLAVPRLCVFRTPKHIYAQVIAPDGAHTLVSASTLDPQVRKEISTGGNVDAAKLVGKLVAERAKDAGIDFAAFDRSGFRFHGRIKALADAAREAGLRC